MSRLILFVLSIFVSTAAVAEFEVDELRFNGETVPVRLLVYERDQPTGTVIITHASSCIPTKRKYQFVATVVSWGFNAVLIDHCTKRGVKPHTAQELPANLQVEDRIKDYIAVIDWVKKQKFSNGKIALVGHSRGGEGVLGFLNEEFYGPKLGLPAGYSKSIDAAVAYYPGCHLGSNGLKKPLVPTLVNHGALDALTPVSNCIHYAVGKDGKVENLTIEIYPGAHHGFDVNLPDAWATNPRGQQVLVLSYNKEQTQRSSEITKKFLDDYIN